MLLMHTILYRCNLLGINLLLLLLYTVFISLGCCVKQVVPYLPWGRTSTIPGHFSVGTWYEPYIHICISKQFNTQRVKTSQWNSNIFRVTGPWLTLCQGNPPVTGGFPLQRVSQVDPWCFLWCKSKQMVEQTVELLVIWHTMTLIWGQCNDSP